jgi:hypothetical protein
MNFIKQLFRTIFLVDLFQSWKLKKAGDKIFTGSAEGRAAAFDLERDAKVKEYQEFMEAVSQAEVAVEGKRARLLKIEKSRKEAEKALSGVVSAFTKAEEAGDKDKMAQIQLDGKDYQARVKSLTEQENNLKGEIEAQQAGFKKLERQLASMKKYIADLPQAKADSIAAYISNKDFIEAQNRLDGILSRQEESPLGSVFEADAELAAQAKVVGNLAGQDKAALHDEYLAEADADDADADFAALVNAKKAEKAAATGIPEQGVAEKVPAGRPEI